MKKDDEEDRLRPRINMLLDGWTIVRNMAVDYIPVANCMSLWMFWISIKTNSVKFSEYYADSCMQAKVVSVIAKTGAPRPAFLPPAQADANMLILAAIRQVAAAAEAEAVATLASFQEAVTAANAPKVGTPATGTPMDALFAAADALFSESASENDDARMDIDAVGFGHADEDGGEDPFMPGYFEYKSSDDDELPDFELTTEVAMVDQALTDRFDAQPHGALPRNPARACSPGPASVCV